MTDGKEPFFSGEFQVSMGLPKRLLIPSELRRTINVKKHGSKFAATFIGSVACLYVQSFYMGFAKAQIQPGITPSRELQRWIRAKIGRAQEVDMDNQGRVVLPELFVTRAKLKTELTLVGMYDHIEIWNRDAWDEERKNMDDDLPTIETWGENNLLQRPPVHGSNGKESDANQRG